MVGGLGSWLSMSTGEQIHGPPSQYYFEEHIDQYQLAQGDLQDVAAALKDDLANYAVRVNMLWTVWERSSLVVGKVSGLCVEGGWDLSMSGRGIDG